MISFRYHVVSLLAVLFALAAGVALGSGPLQREDAADPGESATARLAQAQRELDAQGSLLGFQDELATALAPTLVKDRLKGRAVTVVALPGSAEEDIVRVSEAVAAAGGKVTAQLDVDPRLLDVGNRQLVAELSTQVQENVEDAVDVPDGASGYEHLGRLIGFAAATTTDKGTPVDGDADGVLAALSTAELVSVRGNITRRGSLVVMVTGAPQGSEDERAGAGSIVATLSDALDATSDGVVVAGPLASSAADGVVSAVRRDPSAAEGVSTVDVVETQAGAVLAVLALARQAEGATGHYGSSSSANGPLPGGAGS